MANAKIGKPPLLSPITARHMAPTPSVNIIGSATSQSTPTLWRPKRVMTSRINSALITRPWIVRERHSDVG